MFKATPEGKHVDGELVDELYGVFAKERGKA